MPGLIDQPSDFNPEHARDKQEQRRPYVPPRAEDIDTTFSPAETASGTTVTLVYKDSGR